MTWFTNRLHVKDDFDKFWSSFDRCFPLVTNYLSPNEKTFPIELNAAGYAQDDIDVYVEDGILTVVAENEKRGKKSIKTYIPEETDSSTLTASLNLGILTIDAKKIEKPKPKKINVT